MSKSLQTAVSKCINVIHRVQKKRCHWFFAVILQVLTDFHNFFVHNFTRNAKVIGVKIYYYTFVMLLPYRVKVSDTKVTHFTPILALCTCLYRSHLRKPVSMKQTEHSRKSEAQNLCSKCPPFSRTHAFKRLCHCAIADGFGDSVELGATQLHFLEPGVKVNGDYYRNAVLLNMFLLDIHSVFGVYYAFQQDEFIPPEMWPPIRQIWIRWTTASGVCFKRGSTARGSMMWVERTLKVERTTAEGVEAAGPWTPSSRQRLRSGIVVWMHMFA